MAFTAKILSRRFRHLNIVGYLLKRRPTKGGSWVPHVFVNIRQNCFPVLLCAWNLATREKTVFEPFHSQKWLPFEHWSLCWTKLPKWITNNRTQYHTYFWKYWKFKKEQLLYLLKKNPKKCIYYCVKVYYNLVISVQGRI